MWTMFPLLTTVLPMNVWDTHLLPLLTCKDAARLVCTCSVLTGVAGARAFKYLGRTDLDNLRTFPKARAVAIDDPGPRRGGGEEAVTQWLCLGHGRHLEVVTVDAGVVGLWELMASGGLPALAKLNVRSERCWGAMNEVRTRVAPAFEDVGYELGVAVGKLRRLKDLATGLFKTAGPNHALVQGLAASAGERPLPLLLAGDAATRGSLQCRPKWRACSSRVFVSLTRATVTTSRPS
jgi:hypothetical protein